jgi:CPA1 family monovalent cation:H+ antiporter
MNNPQFFWLLLIAFVVALAARRVKVPYPLALVMTGLVVGLTRLIPRAHLDPDTLLTVFLPPLLFESAINLNIEALQRDGMAIGIYTLAGTVASTFIVGGVTALAFHIPIAVGLVFGALISTTDPISVIAVFRRLGAGRRLSLILEAESLFNNDTAVVLFTVTMAAVVGGGMSFGHAVGQFFYLVIGGALLGGAFGVVASRIHYELDDHLVEITLTTVVAFGAYLASDMLHVSGVMAVVVAGIIIGNFGMPRAMSPSTRLAVAAFWEYAAFVVNSIVFLLIGIEVADLSWAHRVPAALAAIGAVLLGRAAIYPISLLINRLGGNIPLSWQHILYWGGLRGALSMALALGLGRTFPARDTIIAATFAVVLFSLLAQGFTVGPLLKYLGLSGVKRSEPHEVRMLSGEILATRAAISELERLRVDHSHPTWAVELLTHEYHNRLHTLEETMDQVQPDYARLQAEREAHARRLALAAEKGAWMDAERSGWLEPHDWAEIRRKIDAELVAIAKHPGN